MGPSPTPPKRTNPQVQEWQIKTMNVWQLLEKVNVRSQGCGNYLVAIEFKGKQYFCHSNNSLAYDRIYNQLIFGVRERFNSYTLKQALQTLYDEVKRKNNL